MGTKPLTPAGGTAAGISFRLQHTHAHQLEEIARRRGMTRSECIRTLLTDAIDTIDKEVSAAS